MYAHKGEDGFQHVFSFVLCTQMCGNKPIYKVKVTERHDLPLPEPKDHRKHMYIGLLNEGDNEPSCIQDEFFSFNVQFEYGYAAHEKAGLGKAVILDIEEISLN